MSKHLTIIQKAVTKKSNDIDRDISFIIDSILVSVQYDAFFSNGDRCEGRRLFVNTDDSGNYRFCGWFVHDDIKKCMICGSDFKQGLLTEVHWRNNETESKSGLEKYSCRACGIVVCHDCSPEKAMILDLNVDTPQRVCVLCNYGQVRNNIFIV